MCIYGLLHIRLICIKSGKTCVLSHILMIPTVIKEHTD